MRWRGIPPYVLPAPSVIFQSLWTNAGGLMRALGNTALVTLSAFVLATISGIALGILISLFRTVEKIIWPYAVALQVTPIIAIAPLVIIWVGLSRVWLALLILSWLVAFFPMLSATVVGMKSVDRGLQNVFTLYRATRWERLLRLQFVDGIALHSVRRPGLVGTVGHRRRGGGIRSKQWHLDWPCVDDRPKQHDARRPPDVCRALSTCGVRGCALARYEPVVLDPARSLARK